MEVPSSETARLRRILINSRATSLYKRVFGLPVLGARIRSSAAVKLLEPRTRRKQRILDAGCSWGALLFELSRAGGLESLELIGVDLSVEALRDAGRVARSLRTGAFHALAADMRFLPFADNSFDSVICTDVLEHIEDDRLAIRDLRRTLRPDGRLILTVPNAEQKTAWVSTSSMELFNHVREGYSLEGLRRLAEGQGLSILRTSHAGNLFGAAAWEVSLRLLSLFKSLAIHSALEAVTFPIFFGLAKLDSWSGDRAWGKWLLLEACKDSDKEKGE